MANKQISDLTAASTLDGTEEVHVKQSSNSRRATSQNIANLALASTGLLGTPAQGDIIYRGASAYARLGAGTNGQVLTTRGAGANPEWADASSGSTNERTRSVPVVASFTLENAGTASITNVTSGIKLSCPSATSNFRFVRQNAALPGATWTMIARVAPLQPRDDTTQFQRCLVVRNSSNGRMLMMHDRDGNNNVVVDRWAGYTAPAANALAAVSATRMWEMPWLRITFDGTTFAFGCSPDGYNDTFYDFYSETAATYLTAAGGSGDQVGWGNWVDSGAYTIAEILQSFEVF